MKRVKGSFNVTVGFIIGPFSLSTLAISRIAPPSSAFWCRSIHCRRCEGYSARSSCIIAEGRACDINMSSGREPRKHGASPVKKRKLILDIHISSIDGVLKSQKWANCERLSIVNEMSEMVSRNTFTQFIQRERKVLPDNNIRAHLQITPRKRLLTALALLQSHYIAYGRPPGLAPT
ncbi:hypothetical protein EVAR_61559_1 [Eumeta japonica]|uniref:Uncharacterized protein n=1 Tax=Eumeta variegata TaxID=151549 RepID=A0A4C1ZAG7_EUMVA|nr:hypothetical protein EVAR_61559_1 [Eumeta japonica]